MTLNAARARVETEVYRATAVFEEMEADGLIRGNGHHMRQRAAKLAADLLEERWLLKKW